MTPALPFVLSIPHAGLDTPPELAGRTALDDVDIYNECDLWADRLFDFAAADSDGQGVLATVTTPFARALIDVNRAPDSLDDPDGVVKSRSSYGKEVYVAKPLPTERTAWRDKYWGDYHAHLGTALEAAQGRVRLLIDCHNMAQTGPSHYAYSGQARPFLCLANLGDVEGEPKDGPVTLPGHLLRAAGEIAAPIFADLELLEPTGARPAVVALNHPFRGGYIIRRHCRLTAASNAGTPNAGAAHGAPLALMVEVNRGLFVGNQGPRCAIQPPNVERIEAIRTRLERWAIRLAEILPEVQE